MASRKQSGRIGGRRAGFREYEAFFKSEQVHKFAASEVGFAERSPVAQHCEGCVHWFVNPQSGWTPCEILHRSDNRPVPGGAVCRFWNQGGRGYPLLNVL